MDYEYKVNGQTVRLAEDPDLVGVRYLEPAPHSLRAAFSSSVGADVTERIEIPNEKFTLLKSPSAAPMSVSHAVNAAVGNRPAGVARTTPVFKLGETRVLATDRILLGMKDPATPVSGLLKDVNYESIAPRGFGEYTVTLAPDVDPLATVQQLAPSEDLAYIEPDFVNLMVKPALDDVSADAAAQGGPGSERAYAARQYAIQLTAADQAWKLVQGNLAIKIAVLDDGIDTRHLDLRQSVIAGYDACDKDNFQEPNAWDGHGTACAGLAAAVPSSTDGVRGIGGGCSIMAVRIAYSDRPRGVWTTSPGQIAEAVDWCWQNGASVLSNSWSDTSASSAVIAAFGRALTLGRGGKGCVVVVAAGNRPGPVGFPSNLPGVICVAASTPKDEPKTPSSDDGENWWGSSYGPEVLVAAPGVKNYTTDITGPAGYNPGGDYYPGFNGTSSATPLVAGACALVLSANPTLSGAQVTAIIAQSADKVGSVSYVDGRNDQMGYGRLNVLKAVQLAITS
ncbi:MULTISPECIES: S8 family serine peptidase [Massilia]|uniref:Subtilase family protein n=1 Tax=Massilia timonae TaxID=47229 RepID=A0A1S2N7N6_9BURK|nr:MULTISPECIES: S8 family serine peptidase [Massilia]OIJ40312.1 subtilase family protein [Massilia timonae]QYG00607.1 S8 family serine peptidase [Massilia sp. NP310]